MDDAREPWSAQQIGEDWYVVRNGDAIRVRVTAHLFGRVDESPERRALRIAKVLNALAG